MSAIRATITATKCTGEIKHRYVPLLGLTPSKQAELIADEEWMLQAMIPGATITTSVVYTNK